MLVAAAVLPHPPVLVPEVAGRAAGELDRLRDACDEAVGAVLAVRPDLVVVVGTGRDDGDHPPDAVGSLHGYGVDLAVALDGSAPAAGAEPVLPLSLTVGGWLLARSGWSGRVVGRSLPPDLPPGDAAVLGADLAGKAPAVGLLVMGDGAVHRSESGLGYPDPGGEDFADAVAGALARGDTAALAVLDAGLAGRLQAAGRGPWQVLAGAADASRLPADVVQAQLLDRSSPYGVDYLVATWVLPGRS